MKTWTKENIETAKAVVNCDYGSIEIPIKDIVSDYVVEVIEDGEDDGIIEFELKDYVNDWLLSTMTIDLKK